MGMNAHLPMCVTFLLCVCMRVYELLLCPSPSVCICVCVWVLGDRVLPVVTWPPSYY